MYALARVYSLVRSERTCAQICVRLEPCTHMYNPVHSKKVPTDVRMRITMYCTHVCHIICNNLAHRARVPGVAAHGAQACVPCATAALVRADITMEVQVEGSSSGSTSKHVLSLMFPGSCRTVVRVLEAWHEAQVRVADCACVASRSPTCGASSTPGTGGTG